MGLWAGIAALTLGAAGALLWESAPPPPSASSTIDGRGLTTGAEVDAPREVSAGPPSDPPQASARVVEGRSDGGAMPGDDALAERRAQEREVMRERRQQKRERWLERRRERREQKEAHILESVADDPEARAHWEARFEERRRKREQAEWRRSTEGRQARQERAREHAARAQERGPAPALPDQEGAVIGGPSRR